MITVTWQNWNGTVLQTKTYNKGDSEPSYSGSTPTRPNDSNYSYTFSGWNLISSTSTTKTYQAQYTSVAKITVTWQNWDNSILQTKTYFANESEPSYSGSTPTRPDDIPSSGNGTRYTFSSWILVSSSSNTKVYRAQYSTQVLYIWDRYSITSGVTQTGSRILKTLPSDFPKDLCEFWASASTYAGTTTFGDDNGTCYISNGKWYQDEKIAGLGDGPFVVMGSLSNLSINETYRSEKLSYWTITVFELRIDGANVGGNYNGNAYLQFYSIESNTDTYGVREYTYSRSPGEVYDYVTSTSSSAYPTDGVSGNYWYVRR